MRVSNFFVSLQLMIELERHIEILLLSNDCVIVPNFGGFVAHHSDARYSESDNLFLPPLRTIGFNPQLKLNDSVLAQSFVEAYDISYPEAMRRIEQNVAMLRGSIEDEGEYTLNGVGTLRLTDEGKYDFEPCEAGLLTPSFYGFGSFEMKTLAQKKAERQAKLALEQQKEEAEYIADNTFAQEHHAEQKPVTIEVETAEIKESAQQKEQQTITIPMSVARNILIAAVMLIAFLLFPSSLSDSNNKVNQSAIDTNLLHQVMPHTSDVKHSEHKVVSVKKAKAEKKEKKEEKKEAGQMADEHKPYFSVVLTSKVPSGNAHRYVHQLHKQGYDEAHVLANGNSSKVVYGRYETRSRANAVMNKLNNREIFADCWVTKVY